MPEWRNALDEGIALQKSGALDRALERYRTVAERTSDPAVLSEALRRQSSVHRTQSDFPTALDAARRAGETASAANLHEQYAEALNAEALVHWAQGDFATAADAFEKILSITNDLRINGNALQNLGAIAAQTGDWELARRRFHQSTVCFQKSGNVWGEAYALGNYGRTALDYGNAFLAAEMLEQALGAARRLEDRDLFSVITMNYAEAMLRRRDATRAEGLAREAMSYFAEAGNSWRQVECLRLLGDIARAGSKPEDALRLYEEGLRLAKSIGAAAEVTRLEQCLQAMQAA